MMRDKLGLFGKNKDDKKLIDDLLTWMEKNKADYTNTFCYLMNIKYWLTTAYIMIKTLLIGQMNWQNRISINDNSKEKSLELMKETNPSYYTKKSQSRRGFESS